MDKNTIIDNLVIDHNASFRNTTETSVPCKITIDYTGCTLGELASWANGNRAIAGQRAFESMSADEIRSSVDGKTFHARNIGKKIKSRDDQITSFETSFINAGLDPSKARALAIASVDNPELINIETN